MHLAYSGIGSCLWHGWLDGASKVCRSGSSIFDQSFQSNRSIINNITLKESYEDLMFIVRCASWKKKEINRLHTCTYACAQTDTQTHRQHTHTHTHPHTQHTHIIMVWISFWTRGGIGPFPLMYAYLPFFNHTSFSRFALKIFEHWFQEKIYPRSRLL